MKKYAKWMGIFFITPFLLIFMLAVLLYLPPVQNWAVRQVASYASESTGMDISVRHVQLVFPLKLGVEGVKVLQPIDSLKDSRNLALKNKKDTVADIGKIVVDVQLKPLFNNQVMVDELYFTKMKVNTTNFIREARIKGNVGKLRLIAHGIDLGKERVNVDDAILADASLSVELSDTVPPDTTPSTNYWKINIQKLKLKNTDFALHMPGDTLQVNAYLGDALARTAYLDLYKGLYQVEHLDWKNCRVNYDQNFVRPVSGLDFNHLAFTDMALKADSFYFCDSKIDVKIREAKLREKCGLHVEQLYGRFVMDSLRLQLPDIYLRTPSSNLQASVDMDLNAFAEKNPGKMMARVNGAIGRSDLFLFIGDVLPKQIRRHWPFYAMKVEGTFKGNMQYAYFSGVKMSLPTVFQLNTNGVTSNMMNPGHLKADIHLQARTYNLDMVTAMLEPALRHSIRIPSGVGIDGTVKVDGTRYGAQLALAESIGRMRIDASVDAKTHGDGSLDMNRLAYRAKLQARNVQAKHFLPRQELYAFTGEIEARGVGTDFLSPHTRLTAKAKVNQVHYGKYHLCDVLVGAQVADGKIHAKLDSKNDLLNGVMVVDALASTKKLQASLIADVRHADMYQLQVTQKPVGVSLCGQIDIHSDLKDNHKIWASMGDITVKAGENVYRPVGVNVDVKTSRDTTHAIVACGDFFLNMDAHGGYQMLLDRVGGLRKELWRQFKNRRIDQVKIRNSFPLGHVYLSTGKDNFISRFINYMGYSFKSVEMNLNASPVAGLEGYMSIDSLVASGVQLDTIRALVHTQGDTIRYSARVQNNKHNPQYVFRALLDGEVQEHGSNVKARIYDAANKLGVDVGLAAMLQPNGVKLALIDTHPVLGYKEFIANDSNYVMLSDDGRVSADLVLKAASGGMGLRVYSNDENMEALQDLTVSMSKFNLDKVLSVIPYMPDITGIMDGDFHVIQTKEELSVSSNLKIDNMTYEKCLMGDVGTEFTYMPKSDGSHYVDGVLTYEGDEVATVAGTYKSEGAGELDAVVGLEKLPLHFVNGFVPDQIIGLKGYGEGNLKMKGALSDLDVDGEIYLDSAYLVSVPYGVSMRFANDPVRITDSKLLFENFMMYANNESPLNIQGDLDFTNVERMKLNVRMRAQDFLLIDAEENARSEAFGKAYVNFFGSMQGSLSNLKMMGRLDVLGKTNMTYVLRESELTTDNQLEELVKFTNFKSGKEMVVQKPALEGFDMLLSMSIDESARILCALNADKTNYVDLLGGGDLQMRYNTADGIRLTGRYTLSDGEMKYSLPIIPLKTFDIQDGSYIQFTGDPFNPTLNITATENVKTTVNEGEGSGRSVNFVCGVKLSQTLEKPGIQFIVSASNDQTIQDELNSMSIEERGKIAITMLASGMYLASGTTSSFSMNTALTSFLNSEINNIAGTAMRSIGLDVGMSVDNQTNASGALHTDYNFKFAKRFFNNRLSFSVGGQVSTGAELDNATNKNETFFNNVEVQYRLNEGASMYIRAFYNANTYDWLDGQIGEYGGGFTWRRKLSKFTDIFRFKPDRQQMPSASPAQQLKKDTIPGQAKKKDTIPVQGTKIDTVDKARTSQMFDPLKAK